MIEGVYQKGMSVILPLFYARAQEPKHASLQAWNTLEEPLPIEQSNEAEVLTV